MADSFTVQISSNLINKLARDGMEPKKRPKKSKPKTPQVPPKHSIEPNSTVTEPKTSSSSSWPPQTPMFLPLPATMPPPPPPLPASVTLAELEAIRSSRKESEDVVKKLEEETDMTQELTKRAKELRDKEFKLPHQKSMPCEAEREACRECYRENLKQPLKCAQVVRLFEDCARRARREQQQVNLGL